ncbi:hypothetical protein L226DRAFT_239418 [Lentinus tigrinus ALCF2SS1-7]|uniref:uncharacterized protein n=1 Tax=Lentinus tigrinus ALCF2SS1-7 TaxID=1328758 RepID=UPI0011663524|nr:hypothetical protein L226DRAFT_239418 [Lentinus tigrinus ALCF2SS1-7]
MRRLVTSCRLLNELQVASCKPPSLFLPGQPCSSLLVILLPTTAMTMFYAAGSQCFGTRSQLVLCNYDTDLSNTPAYLDQVGWSVRWTRSLIRRMADERTNCMSASRSSSSPP